MVNLRAQKEKETKEKDKIRREKLAGFFFDAAKMTLGGIVIGGLSPIFTGSLDFVNIKIISLGVVSTYIFAKIGNDILK